MFKFDKNKKYSLYDTYEFEIKAESETIPTVVDISEFCTEDLEFLRYSRLHYIVAKMKVVDSGKNIVMDDTVVLHYDARVVCSIEMLKLVFLFESYGCECDIDIIVFIGDKRCDKDGIPLSNVDSNYTEFLDELMASPRYTHYIEDDTCSACRGGGCPHCEPWRFI